MSTFASAAFLTVAALAGPMGGGTVQTVTDAPPPSRAQSFVDFYEHAVRPASAHQVTVILDDGRAVRLVRDAAHPVKAGQRVRVVLTNDGVRIEPE
jgi:hypothetical protein